MSFTPFVSAINKMASHFKILKKLLTDLTILAENAGLKRPQMAGKTKKWLAHFGKLFLMQKFCI